MTQEELELTDEQKRIFEWVDKTSRTKFRFQNALAHIQMAWKIKDIDRNMAVFRGITAEEEAATGIFLALQRKGYQNANKIRPNAHAHKAALIPFLHVLQKGIKSIIGEDAKISLVFGGPNDPDRMKVRAEMNIDGQGAYLWPHPPLSMTLSMNGKFIDLSESLKNLANANNVNTVQKFIEQKANERNLLLYASDQKIPQVTSIDPSFFRQQLVNISALSIIYLLIEQYDEQQAFAQQALDEFIKVIEQLRY